MNLRSVGLSLVLACGGSATEPPVAETPEATIAEPPGEPPNSGAPSVERVSVELPSLSLSVTLPLGYTVRRDDIFRGDRITAEGSDFELLVKRATPQTPDTLVDALEESERMHKEAQSGTELADGWMLLAVGGGLTTSYGVVCRRRIGFKDVLCMGNGSTPEQQELAAAICRSIR